MIREFFGDSVEEALVKAGLRYGVEAQSLEYTVVDGEFGSSMDSKKVAVLVVEPEKAPGEKPPEMPTEPAPEKKPGSREWAIYVLEGIFTRMGIPVKIGSQERGENTILTVELPEETLDLRRGESRELRGAIQHLVNRSASGEGEGDRRFIVDIGGTLEKRREKMNDLAGQLAVWVNENKKSIHIHLMDSQDRRILHTALADEQQIATMARGEGQFRVLKVEPKKAR
jgi:spoIIIJ-associated protein